MYTIIYHKLIWKEDFKKIPKIDRQKILNTIEKKLSFYPKEFGKALHGELKGYFRLRIKDYRVIYRIEKDKIIIFVLHIGFRRNFEVYIKAAKRLGILN